MLNNCYWLFLASAPGIGLFTQCSLSPVINSWEWSFPKNCLAGQILTVLWRESRWFWSYSATNSGCIAALVTRLLVFKATMNLGRVKGWEKSNLKQRKACSFYWNSSVFFLNKHSSDCCKLLSKILEKLILTILLVFSLLLWRRSSEFLTLPFYKCSLLHLVLILWLKWFGHLPVILLFWLNLSFRWNIFSGSLFSKIWLWLYFEAFYIC